MTSPDRDPDAVTAGPYPVTDWRHVPDISTPVEDLPEVPW